MKIFFLRSLFILALVFFEFSFFDVLAPSVSAPLILISSVVVWTLLSGFPGALPMIIPLTILFDLVSSGTLGTLTLYAIPLAYATSFLSRRLLVEHRGMGMILYALCAAVSNFGYLVVSILFFQGHPLSFTRETLTTLFSALSFAPLMLSMLLTLPLFALAYAVIRRFEERMGFIAQGEILPMR
ncbi:MAG: hypothetical protein A2878_00065 [Candidatus Moranbacteria bacterium RIFCSPHIGHO2_01_FULL_54_31]|nr:MAG: hypothetical protein A2878_00065 [Candidatus Moranbacteria bacterium RIFCSPHIGHO2_01_FULL_54_31]